MQRLLTFVMCFSLAAFLSGCAGTPQQAVQFTPTSLSESSRVGVVVDIVPSPDTAFPGAGCLLCLATASAMNSSLTTQVRTLSNEDLTKLGPELVGQLNNAGYHAVLLEDAVDVSKLPKLKRTKVPNSSERDFSSLKKSDELDHILVVEFYNVGVHRNYSSYIPTGAPQALVTGRSYLINMETNTYDWYNPVSIYRSADGEWDEPPTFPGITNAFYQAVEDAKDIILKSFIPEPITTATLEEKQ